MADGELLEQLRKIVREEIEAEGKHTHTDITLLKMEVKGGMLKLEDRMKDLEVSNGRLESGQRELTKKSETVELNIEALRKGSRQAHNEIMTALTESNEINGKQIANLKGELSNWKKMPSSFPTEENLYTLLLHIPYLYYVVVRFIKYFALFSYPGRLTIALFYDSLYTLALCVRKI